MYRLVLLTLWFSGAASADIYKWTDEAGNIHYGESPGQGQTGNKLEIQTTYAEPAPVAKPESVVMYATSWCGYCAKARSYFREKQIDYVEFDIEKDQAAKRRYDAMGGRGVPVILVGNKRMNGFSIPEFNKIYR